MNKNILLILLFVFMGSFYLYANQTENKKVNKPPSKETNVQTKQIHKTKEKTKASLKNKKEQAIYFKSKHLWHSKSISNGLVVEVYQNYTTPIITRGIGELDYAVSGNDKIVKTSYPQKNTYSGEIFLEPKAEGKTNLFLKFRNGKYFHLTVHVLLEKEDTSPLPFYALDELVQMGKERDSVYSKSNMIKIVENYDQMKKAGILQGINVHKKRFDFPAVKHGRLEISVFECFTFQKENGRVFQIFTFVVKNDSGEWIKLSQNEASLMAGRKDVTKHDSLENFDEIIPDAMQIDHYTLSPSQMTTGMIFVENVPLHVEGNNFKIYLVSKTEKVAKFKNISGLEGEK